MFLLRIFLYTPCFNVNCRNDNNCRYYSLTFVLSAIRYLNKMYEMYVNQFIKYTNSPPLLIGQVLNFL